MDLWFSLTFIRAFPLVLSPHNSNHIVCGTYILFYEPKY